MPAPDAEPAATRVQLDLGTLLAHAPWPVRITLAVLVVSSCAVWLISALKFFQLARIRGETAMFESQARRVRSADELTTLGVSGDSPGARVVHQLRSRPTRAVDRLRAAADRALVDERRRMRRLLSPLGTIATAAPFIGLFGTVYGIMDAFVRIGAAKSASLPVVAPAIGEALITTAIGLAAAIPAVVFYNAIDKRASDLLAELEAAAAEWVAILTEGAR